MSPAVTGPAPCFTSLSVTGCRANERSRSFLMLRTIWVTSSFTFGSVLNSWKTFAIWIEVTAALQGVQHPAQGVAQGHPVAIGQGLTSKTGEVALCFGLLDAWCGVVSSSIMKVS